MKQTYIFLMLLALFAIRAEAQQSSKKKNAPDEQIKVQREYDEEGNLIRFDSIRVFSWSSDSTFKFSPGGGWESMFGKDFFSDSTFALNIPHGRFPFNIFSNGDDFFGGMELSDIDSAFFKNFMFHNDSSFFMGPDSSFMLPPGFFMPQLKGFDDLQKFFDQRLENLFFHDFSTNPADPNPSRNDSPPRKKKEIF